MPGADEDIRMVRFCYSTLLNGLHQMHNHLIALIFSGRSSSYLIWIDLHKSKTDDTILELFYKDQYNLI